MNCEGRELPTEPTRRPARHSPRGGGGFSVAACTLDGVFALLLAATAAAQPAPALDAAPRRVAAKLAGMLGDLCGRDRAVELLLERAVAPRTPPADAALLFHYALDQACASGRAQLVTRVLDVWAKHGGRDLLERYTAALRTIEQDGAASSCAMVGGYLHAAEYAARLGDRAGCLAAWEGAVTAAKRDADPGLRAFVAAQRATLDARCTLWQKSLAHPEDADAHGRALCFADGKWGPGAGLMRATSKLETQLLTAKRQATPDSRTCTSIADSWLAWLRGRDIDPVLRDLIRERVELHAIGWYRRAWHGAPALEQSRLHRAMSLLEDRLLTAPGPGRARFAGDGLAQMILSGGVWRVERGLLVGRNTGDTCRATCRYAFREIRSVVLRAGIRSPAGRNLRVAIGGFNALLNWEVDPVNLWFVGDKRTVTKPMLCQPGKEHELRIRQIEGEVVVWFDGAVVYRAPWRLAGTVCVYPAVHSEVFVRELQIEGVPDLFTTVTGPVGTTR